MSDQEKSSLLVAAQSGRISRDIEPPHLGLKEALNIASSHFGVTGRFIELSSERDQIFKLTTFAGIAYVLRISSYAETSTVLEFQNEALSKIAAEYPELPVPRLRTSIRGKALEIVSHGGRSYGARLFSFLRGEPVEAREPSPALYRDIGRTLATLDKALNGLGRPPANDTFLWNMHQAGNLYPLVVHVEEPDHRRLVEAVFERLNSHTFARLSRLRSQIIHNDCNSKNILVDSSVPDRVSGLIDFGDMTESALVVELGVAVARQVRVHRAVASACELIEGYHATLPLQEDEIEVLFDVICARLAMRALIWSWRKSVGDPRCQSRGVGDTFELLARWISYGPQRSTAEFRAACKRTKSTPDTGLFSKEKR